MRRRTGRPSKNLPKTRFCGRVGFSVYLEPSEAQAVREAADAADLPHGEFIRYALAEVIRQRILRARRPN